MAWERVYTIDDYWDGPRHGVADVFGVPHIYDSPFNSDKDDREDFFVVSPIEPELLRLVLEGGDIWIRWNEAFDRGEVSVETHPALAHDRARHDEIQMLIGDRFQSDPANSRKLKATFRSARPGWNGMEVEWSELDCQ